MGAAAMAYVLWTRFLRFNPAHPGWPDRDRFILSAGHGSMLLYSLLHLTGFDLTLDDIRSFRQLDSRTPGHPESHLTVGVEATTGPLGQGISNAVGFAIAEAHLAARFNRPGHALVNHHTWVLASDGDLMEGVSAEAASLAGHLRLGKLVVLYDDNRISLSGTTDLTFSEDVRARFASYGWRVDHVADGNDLDALTRAIGSARETSDRPSLIAVRTHIGFGAPHKQDTYHAHGSPLGPDELRAAKEHLGWPVEPAFLVPPDAAAHLREAGTRGQASEAEWTRRLEAYRQAFPTEAAEFERVMAGRLPPGWDRELPTFPADPKGLATRKASEAVMQVLAARLPELTGGSADLNPSTFTWLKGQGDFQSPTTSPEGVQGAIGGDWSFAGRNLHFGVREHAMGAAVNGMSLHGGVIPYGSTFLMFSDYMRGAVRLSALSKLGSVWVYTHDSIGVGEDGPTHQPVEHYAALRAIPDLLFIRPADANETTVAWTIAIENRHRPTVLALSRQNLPVLDRSRYAAADGVRRGAYVLNPDVTQPELILLATGSEMGIVVTAAERLASAGTRVRIVSMPCWELFEEQPPEYRNGVLPPGVGPRLAVEVGVSLGWHRWVGERGAVHALDHFGASAPAEQLFTRFGFTVEEVVARARALLRS
jgi:transketolase